MFLIATYILIFVLLLLMISGYFKVARRFEIVDRPNHRSSHTSLTIRGGGIIFPLAIIVFHLFFYYNAIYFTVGLVILSVVSFIDDVKGVSSKVRILCHLIGICLLFYQLKIFELPVIFITMGFIFTIGIINAINFMDGINGMTGSYALTILLTLLYINETII